MHGQGAQTAHYVGQPDFRWDPNGRNMYLLGDYAFVDNAGSTWNVPKGAEVDGASIPRMFWSLMGGPFEGKYRDASVIHDYFCSVRTRPWKAVDRMFYEAMIVSGVAETEAKVMYLAVVWAGPRWDDQDIHNNLLAPADRFAEAQEKAGLPPQAGAFPRKTPEEGAHGRSASDRNAERVLDARFSRLSATVKAGNISLDEIDGLAENER